MRAALALALLLATAMPAFAEYGDHTSTGGALGGGNANDANRDLENDDYGDHRGFGGGWTSGQDSIGDHGGRLGF